MEAVHQRRPQELPGVREHHQREQAERFDVKAGLAEPRLQQAQQNE
jgi:hypothetical protein